MDEQCRWLLLGRELLREGKVRHCPFGCSAMARLKDPVNSYEKFLRVRVFGRGSGCSDAACANASCCLV